MNKVLTLALASTALALAGCASAPMGEGAANVAVSAPIIAASPSDGELSAGFANPPAEARPRTWWHWMYGNVTHDGIAKDLAWMHEIGIGGFQNFDANLNTPHIVDEPLSYMTPKWKDAFRFAASEAVKYDLEMAIAASPGWSETGGPWVAPEDGVKKLVWGETRLEGGAAFSGQINRAPSVTGPYQNLHFHNEMAGISGGEAPPVPVASGQIAVLAVPINEPILSQPRFTLADGSAVEAAPLLDNDLESGFALALSDERQGLVNLTYDEPVTVRTMHLSLPGLVRPFRDPPILPILEAKLNGAWKVLAEIPLTNTPATHTFEPITASEFRLRIEPFSSEQAIPEMEGAEGAVVVDFFALGDISKVPLNDLRLSGAHRMSRAQEKAGFAGVYDYYQIMSDDTGAAQLSLGDAIDISEHVAADGTLNWTPPTGSDWRVLDFGWSLIGTTNHPAPPEATGLEVDKYDPAAVRRYMETYLGMYRETLGDDMIGERGLRAILTDSIEVGFANWTPAMEAEFEARRGYALRPWMPALTGMVIGSEAETERFLYDWRDTLAELLTDYHYGTVADVAHENGLMVYGEALEDKRPMLGDDLSMRRHADVPMAALWTYPRGGQVRTTLLGDMKGAASTAHVYGQKFVAAESMTAASSPWAFAPRDLRRFIDLEFAYGINRPVIHTSVHQPSDEHVPGLSLAIFGQYFNRHETWADMAKPWITYMSRNAYMLQQGQYFADVAYFRGEEAPVTAQFAYNVPEGLPVQYGYDFINADMLADGLRVENGMVVSQGGTQYRAIFLGPDTQNMTLPTLRRLADMAEKGAVIIGEKPAATPSFADDGAAFAQIADQLWASDRVLATSNVEEGLAGLGLAPDFAFSGGGEGAEILFLHRQLEAGHLYFLTNRQNRAEQVEARFRVTGYVPEWWDAVSGTSRPLNYRIEGEHSVISLDLAAEESGFVVFRAPSDADGVGHVSSAPEVLTSLDGLQWQVEFEEGRGAPEGAISLAVLQPLNEMDLEGIRYFSGTASYSAQLEMAEIPAGKQLWLDLGQVGDVAEIWVNGQYAGTSWFAPDRVEISQYLRQGSNDLVVKVANLWVNRLIGDAQPNAEKTTFTAAPTYMPNAPLRLSGLIGPVQLLVSE